MVGVILNTYKRNDLFKTQLEAIRNQSVKPEKIIVWRNGDSIPDSEFKDVDFVKASRNMGVWVRFSLARDLKTDFTWVIDDDTIPGKEWLETCLSLYNQRPNLYCAHGFRFKNVTKFNEGNFHSREQFGPFNKKPYPVAIDWAGHSWFFDNEVLRKSLNLPRAPHDTAGEDAHISYSAQLVGQGCFVTPYDEDSKRWGSLKAEQGNDKNATHRVLGQRQRMVNSLNFYREQGWKFVEEN